MSEDPVGITVHFLGAMTVPTSTSMARPSRNLQFGDELVLTAEVIEALRDRHGRVRLLELLDDEPAQVLAYGSVKVRRGPWDPSVERIQPGSYAWDQARERERALALSLPEGEQRVALARVREKYGMPSSSTSTTIARYGDAR